MLLQSCLLHMYMENLCSQLFLNTMLMLLSTAIKSPRLLFM